MALTCPHVIWRITPFNTSNNCFTESFEFFRCDWRWEYSVHSKDDNEMPEEIISIHLRRLTNSPACSLTRFSTIASIRDSDGEHHAVRILNHKISPEVSWCVWKKSKYYIIGHDVVENNGCAFSLTLEPLDHLEFMDCALNEENENYDISCLQELSCDFEKLMTYSRNADIILRCGNTEVKAHKDVLCFRSKKFTDMIEVKDNLQKISAENLDHLILPSMDPIVFVILIRYIYTATLPDLTNELARKIYEAAHEYSIDSLKKKCTKFMIEHISNIDAIEVLQFANDHNDDNMKWAVSSYIASKLNILNSGEWKTFSETNQGLAVHVFKIFTERLNSRQSPANLTNEWDRKIYEAAYEYSIDSLKKKCTKFMIEHLSKIDAIEVLQFANDHSDDHMKWAVFSYIASKLNILNSDEWKIFSETNQGLAVDVLKIFTERLNSRESPASL